MNRRNFLRCGILAVPSSVGTMGLSGCGGGGGDDAFNPGPGPNPGPVCRAGAFAKGLNPASDALLQAIPTASQLTFIGAASRSGVINGLPQTAFPDYFDLTDAQLMSQYGFPIGMLPPVGDQGRLGSCVAWGVGYAAASFMKALTSGTLSTVPGAQASPSDLYIKTLLREQPNPCSNGTLVKDALDVLIIQGVASLQSVPYVDNACVSPSNQVAYTLDSYWKIAPGDSAAIKTAISNFSVLPFGIRVYEDFESYKGGVYDHPAGDTSCGLGGHCMALIGYDDARRAYRIQNSWGIANAWGEAGKMWMGYDTFSRIAMEVYAPYLHNNQTPNNLIRSAGTVSGSISAQAANVRLFYDPAVDEFTKALVSFTLNAPIRLTGYRFRYVPNDINDPPSVASAVTTDVISKGSLFQIDFPRGFIHSAGSYILDVAGQSLFGESISLAITIGQGSGR